MANNDVKSSLNNYTHNKSEEGKNHVCVHDFGLFS